MIMSRIPRRRTVPANRRLQTRRRLEVESLECRQLLSAATVPTAAQPASTGTSDAPGDLSTVYLSNTNTSPVVSVGNMTFILANVNGMNQVWRSYGYVSPAVAISPLTSNVSEVASTGTGLYILADTNWGNSGASQVYQVFHYTGSGTNSSWTAITGTNTNVSQITANGTGLFMLGNNGGISQVWRYTGSGTNWAAVTATNTYVFQLTSTGTGVYMAALTGRGQRRLGLQQLRYKLVGGGAEQHGHLPDRLDRRGESTSSPTAGAATRSWNTTGRAPTGQPSPGPALAPP